MSMFVKLKDKVINLAHVVYAERIDETGQVTLHYALAREKGDGGTGHVREVFTTPDADVIWKQLQSL